MRQLIAVAALLTASTAFAEIDPAVVAKYKYVVKDDVAYCGRVQKQTRCLSTRNYYRQMDRASLRQVPSIEQPLDYNEVYLSADWIGEINNKIEQAAMEQAKGPLTGGAPNPA